MSARGRAVVLPVVAVVAVGALGALGASTLVASRGPRSAIDALMGANVDLATLPATLPLRELGGAYLVDATVTPPSGDGQPVRATFMLDTGAPTTILPALSERVAGPPAGAVEEMTVTGERAMRDIVPVGSLTLGGATFDSVAALTGSLAYDHPIRCITQDGLLGADVMSDAVWQLDPQHGRLTIATSTAGLDHVEGAIRSTFTPFTPASPSPVIELATATGRLRVVVDTGSDAWLAVHPDDLEAAGGASTSGLETTRAARTWTTGRGALTRIGYGTVDVTLGSERIADLPVATIEALTPGLGVMGTAFLRRFVLTIDWPMRTIFLDRVAGDVEGLVPASDLGVGQAACARTAREA